LRDIAAETGYSHTTVSRALRCDPRLKPDTIQKIQQAADQMGYQPNPMLASLMQAMRTRRDPDTLIANIGWLNTHPDRDHWHEHSYFAHYVEAARKRAREQGYGLEELWTAEPGMTAKRLQQIADSRGVQGFLVPGNVTPLAEMQFDWNPYAVVCLRERAPAQLNWNRSSIAQRENLLCAFRRLRELGYQRIAYASVIYLPAASQVTEMDAFNEGTLGQDSFLLMDAIREQLAGFSYTQLWVEPEHQIRPFLYCDRFDPSLHKLKTWLKQVRADAVITNDHAMLRACELTGLRVPTDLALAHVNLDDDVPDWAGIRPYPERLASAAVDLLCTHIQCNERGEPHFTKHIRIAGDWVDGWTAPPCSA